MNTFKTIIAAVAFGLAFAAAAFALPAHAVLVNQPLPIGSYTTYSGTDRNWFNPANWSTGRVPGPGDIVVLDGTDDVVIDPSQAGGRVPGKININTLLVQDDARLETLPGTQLASGAEIIDGRGQIVTRSSVVDSGATIAADGLINVNPSAWFRTVPRVVLRATLQFGLGGREPAAVQKIGAGTLILTGYGHYATMNADTLILGESTATALIQARVERIRQAAFSPTGSSTRQARQVTLIQDMAEEAAARATQLRLRLEGLPAAVNKPDQRISARIDKLPKLVLALHYDFTPSVGDTFQIITANTLVGQFEDLPEGALVGCTEDDSVGLWISYRGGDGNDVVLDTRPGTPSVCATKEHILLARQVGVPSL